MRLFIFLIKLSNFVIAVEYPLAERSLAFEDAENGQKLIGHSIKSQRKSNQQRCARLCVLTPECLSFNFCESQLCQLNFEELLTDGIVLVDDKFCKYVGIKREQLPECDDDGLHGRETDGGVLYGVGLRTHLRKVIKSIKTAFSVTFNKSTNDPILGL